MFLAPGSRLDPSEVLAAPGQGGVGELLRAREAKLDRDVAIKALPGGFFPRPRPWSMSVVSSA